MTKKMNRVIMGSGLKCRLCVIMAFTAILVLFTVSMVQAAFFDTAGKSARAMGMGEVFLASSSDASGYWYNPAGLTKFETKQIGIGYGKPAAFISDLMTSQINFVTPLGENGGLGLGLSYSGIDVASDMAISGAYGVSLSESFSVGANVKVLRWAAEGQKIAYGAGNDNDISKVSFSLDLSAVYSLGELVGFNDFSAGVYVKDAIMPNISESGDDGGKLPIEIGIGLLTKKNDLAIGGDIATVDGVTVFRVGAESGITGTNLKIRGGFIYGSDFKDELEKTDIDVGLGYVFSSLMFDYAYNLPIAIKETGGRHYVSFGISF